MLTARDFQPGTRVREAGERVRATDASRRIPVMAHAGIVATVRWPDIMVRWEPVDSFVEGESRDSVMEWVLTSDLAIEVVHVLLHGLPLCGFSRDLPAQWPDGHVWTRLGAHDPVSCKGCAAQVRELAR